MSRTEKYLSFIFFGLMVISCVNTQKKKLEGTWAIDSIEKNGQNIMFNFRSNLFDLKRNNDCTFPVANEDKFTNGNWKLICQEDLYYLIISIENNELAGQYRIDFQKDVEKQLLKMTLTSSDTKIVCYKFLTNFRTL